MFSQGEIDKVIDDCWNEWEEEPCEDVISRKAAHDAVYCAAGLASAMRNIEALPSITFNRKTWHCRDCRYYQNDTGDFYGECFYHEELHPNEGWFCADFEQKMEDRYDE